MVLCIDLSFLFQMFPSQAVSLGQIPQGITAQVGPSSLPATNVIPNRTSPPQMYQQQQQGALPTYYDVTQQQQQHAINKSVQHLVLSFFYHCSLSHLFDSKIEVRICWLLSFNINSCESGWLPLVSGALAPIYISVKEIR